MAMYCMEAPISLPICSLKASMSFWLASIW